MPCISYVPTKYVAGVKGIVRSMTRIKRTVRFHQVEVYDSLNYIMLKYDSLCHVMVEVRLTT